MPTYTYRCPREGHGGLHTIIKPLRDLDRVEQCPHCPEPMERVLTAPAVRGDYQGYSCPVTGKWIEGRRAHEENLRRTGCRVLEPGETEGAKRSRIASERALDASIDQTVDRFVETLPTEKKERLAAEVAAGFDVTVTRS